MGSYGLIPKAADYLFVKGSVLGAAINENIVQKCINIGSSLGLLFFLKILVWERSNIRWDSYNNWATESVA